MPERCLLVRSIQQFRSFARCSFFSWFFAACACVCGSVSVQVALVAVAEEWNVVVQEKASIEHGRVSWMRVADGVVDPSDASSKFLPIAIRRPPLCIRIWTSSFFFSPQLLLFLLFFCHCSCRPAFSLRLRLGNTVLTARFIPYPFMPVFPRFRAHFFCRVDLVKLLQQFTPCLVLRFCWMGWIQPYFEAL